MVYKETKDLDDVRPLDDIQDFKKVDKSINNEISFYFTQGNSLKNLLKRYVPKKWIKMKKCL